MLTLLLWIVGIALFIKCAGFIFRMSWGIAKIIFSIIGILLWPVAIILFFSVGLKLASILGVIIICAVSAGILKNAVK